MSVVNDVHAYLANAIGGEIFRRREADLPEMGDAITVIYEDGGAPPEMPAAAGIGDSALGEVGVLITCRAGPWDGDASRTRAQACLDALHGLKAVTLGNTYYLGVRALTTEPVFAGFDATGRPRHTVAFRLLREI